MISRSRGAPCGSIRSSAAQIVRTLESSTPAQHQAHGHHEIASAAPADGKPVRWDAVDIYRVTDGKISEEWAADDVATIMAQIGAFNPPWAA